MRVQPSPGRKKVREAAHAFVCRETGRCELAGVGPQSATNETVRLCAAADLLEPVRVSASHFGTGMGRSGVETSSSPW